MEHIRQKLTSILDANSFLELWPQLHTYNFMDFYQYGTKLENAHQISNEKESVITGIGKISQRRCMIIAFEPLFIMGTLGVVAGEKIARAFQLAKKKRLPVISIIASGGARMQEGVFSLMQMVKTSNAIVEHSSSGLLSISIICDPTLGGVTASFASLADIIIGEKGSRFGFTGKKIIENTTHEKLPDNFQRVEYAQRHGQVDIIAEKDELRRLLIKILELHR